jgi:hypothetical protein
MVAANFGYGRNQLTNGTTSITGERSRQDIAAPWPDVLAALYSLFQANFGALAASQLASYLADIARAVSSSSNFASLLSLHFLFLWTASSIPPSSPPPIPLFPFDFVQPNHHLHSSLASPFFPSTATTLAHRPCSSGTFTFFTTLARHETHHRSTL